MGKQKLTYKEHALCEVFENGFLARNRIGQLSYFINKPIRNKNSWYGGNGIELYPEIFPSFDFIKYEDEPIAIEELLKLEYEYK